MVAHEPVSLQPLADAVLQHSSVEDILAHRLASRLGGNVVGINQWFPVFQEVMRAEYDSLHHPGVTVAQMAREDLQVVQERDPAAQGHLFCMLYFKGYLGIQANRISHVLWNQHRKPLALLVQSKISQVFGMDIHPGAVLGRELMIDHGTGVVIGETSIIGNGCTLLHGVTLGATGKDTGLRHPQLGDDVLVGAGVIVLGCVTLGSQCKIGAGSVVLKSIPEGATAIGCPAKVVGKVTESKPGSFMDTSLCFIKRSAEEQDFKSLWQQRPDVKREGYMCLQSLQKKLLEKNPNLTPFQVDSIIFALDKGMDGYVKDQDVIGNCEEIMNRISIDNPHLRCLLSSVYPMSDTPNLYQNEEEKERLIIDST
mmetsp:Transcript_37037/g.51403  ORF Transcript_37037/g.51403 Transcript_37037/m.51403 type:complete len:368 (+) Transcript_37037:1-1104(+)